MERDIKKIVSEMTLEEKAGMCSGADFWHLKHVDRLGVPQVMVSDGPHGLRKQSSEADHLGINDSIVAVCFPAACATTSSFDTELMKDMGETLGNECQAENLSVLLGPAANIKRSPLCGRNFEYMSEDPYLAGKMATALINGIQSKGVGVSMKHFATNNQEYFRMSNNSVMSERTLREIYLPAFEMAVKDSQPKTIMCSYNKLNGTYLSENKKLLTDILRDEWGFEGYVMTDWGAVADRVEGIRAGLDLEMPASGGITDAQIVAAVKDGSLDEKLVDKCVERMLKVIFSYIDNRDESAVFNRDADHKKAVAIETQSAVLLENNGVLPLKADAKVVYIGEYAEKPRYQGGGSSHINSSKITSALETAKAKGRNVSYVKGFPGDKDKLDEAELKAAVEAAKNADVAVIFAGLPDIFESEGYDREDMNMPECQNRLIEAVAAVNKNTVVVLHNGSPVETPWADNVAAILEMYLGGQGVGEATDMLLYGEENPSGHLAETFPLRVQDNPSYLNFAGNIQNTVYAEGIYVGYRYYDKKKMPVRWAFGHGLSYTDFEIGNIKLSSDKMDDNSKVTVSVDVKNIGKVAGRAVVQLYISDKNGTFDRPEKELKGFGKVMLEPGQTGTINMEICARDLSYYEERLSDWFAPSGNYELAIGFASDDIKKTAKLQFTTKKVIPFEIDGATTLGELLADNRTAPIVADVVKSLQAMFGSDTGSLNDGDGGNKMGEMMLKFMPLKSMASFGGEESAKMVEELIVKLKEAVRV